MCVRAFGRLTDRCSGATIYASELRNRLAGLPSFGNSVDTSSAASLLGTDLSKLTQIQPPELQQQVLHAFTRSISTIWIVCTPLNAVGLLAVLFLRRYSLDRTVNRTAAKDGKAPEGGEKPADGAPVEEKVADEESPALARTPDDETK